MKEEILARSAELFPSIDHWIGFNELCDQRENLRYRMYENVTKRVRGHFQHNPSANWCFEANGNQLEDTRWYLPEFGSDSLGICFREAYSFALRVDDGNRFDRDLIVTRLNTPDYAPLSIAFGEIHERRIGSIFLQHRNFKFDGVHDHNFSERELAWYAEHQTDEFVKQAVEKVERFTLNPEVTKLVRELNQQADTWAKKA